MDGIGHPFSRTDGIRRNWTQTTELDTHFLHRKDRRFGSGLEFAKGTCAIARIVEGRIVFLSIVVFPLGHATSGMACAGCRKFACLQRFRASLLRVRTTWCYRVASNRAVAIPRSQHCPISAGFSTRHSTAPIARLESDFTANT